MAVDDGLYKTTENRILYKKLLFFEVLSRLFEVFNQFWSFQILTIQIKIFCPILKRSLPPPLPLRN